MGLGRMNIYDFDGTIYAGDSTIDFYKYCIKKHPQIVMLLPYQASAFFFYKLGILNKTSFKEKFYCFFSWISDMDSLVFDFWNEHIYKINKWFFELHKPDDVIITASPEFLIAEAAKRIDVHCLIGSKVDPHTGKTVGENCYGKEKVYRFKELFGNAIPDRFFTDSFSDQPMMNYSREAYLVCGNKFKPVSSSTEENCI